MARPTKTEIERACRGVAAAGVPLEEIRVCENGDLRIFVRGGSIPSDTPRDVLDEITQHLGKA